MGGLSRHSPGALQSVARAFLASLVTAGGVLALGYWLGLVAVDLWRGLTAPGPASLEEVLTLAAAMLALALLLWWGLSLLAALLAHLPGRAGQAAHRIAGAMAPVVTRRLAALLVGAALGGAMAPGTAVGEPAPAPQHMAAASHLGPGFRATESAGASTVGDATATTAQGQLGRQVGPGFSATTRAPAGPSGSTDAGASPQPGWVPTRPTERPQASPALVTTAPSPEADAGIVVRRGDTLWDIVRRTLGPEATDAEIAEAWPRWHAANHAVIGADPDLILPGQVLTAPEPAQIRH